MKTFLSFILTIACIGAWAQNDKDIENALKLFQKGDQAKGIEKMEKAVGGSTNSKNWDILVSMYRDKYLATKQGRDETNKSYTDFIKVCRRATLVSRSPLASEHLRTTLVDKDPDTLATAPAREYLKKGNERFAAKDYSAAMAQFKLAIDAYPRYFGAHCRLATSFRMAKLPDSAIAYFKKATAISPYLLEPRAGMVEAMLDKNDFVNVIDEAVNALIVYPDEDMFNRYYFIMHKQYKTFNRYWFPRRYTINSLSLDNEPVEEEPWKTYREAKKEIAPYCNKDGVVVKENTLTKSKYMELYAWEAMLKRPEVIRNANFDFARRMMVAGYLDCFVFFSLFHNDLYEQYRQFANNNRKKITQYIDKYLIVK